MLRVEDTDAARSQESFTRGAVRRICPGSGCTGTRARIAAVRTDPTGSRSAQRIYEDFYARLRRGAGLSVLLHGDGAAARRDAPSSPPAAPPRYAGTCRELSRRSARRRETEGRLGAALSRAERTAHRIR